MDKESNLQLMHGDCLELMCDIKDGSVDLILCDLPYGITACKWDSVIPFEPLWAHYKRIIKKNGAIVLFGSQPFTSALIMSNPKMFKYCWVWDKKNSSSGLLAKTQPLRITEDIIVFSGKKANYYPIMTNGKTRDKKSYGSKDGGVYGKIKANKNKIINDKYYPKSILEFSNANQKGKLHPTQKPVPLLEYLIKTYTNEGETVLDNCMGSGSTGIAALSTGRKFIGIEKDARYFEIAKNRIQRMIIHNEKRDC